MPNKVTAPIARSTAYDFNCHLSLCHTKGRDNYVSDAFATRNPEDANVMPHEVLFAIDTGQINKTSRMRCQSSLNFSALPRDTIEKLEGALSAIIGHQINLRDGEGKNAAHEHVKGKDDNDMDIQRLNAILNEHVRYVGVAVTGCTGGAANALQRQGFSATRGGLMTVMNTGANHILPGHRVRMQLDIRDIVATTLKRRIDGISNQKIVPRLTASTDALMIPIDGVNVDQLQIMIDIAHGYPLMPRLAQLARERFPLRV